jgi:hypothetical protein
LTLSRLLHCATVRYSRRYHVNTRHYLCLSSASHFFLLLLGENEW